MIANVLICAMMFFRCCILLNWLHYLTTEGSVDDDVTVLSLFIVLTGFLKDCVSHMYVCDCNIYKLWLVFNYKLFINLSCFNIENVQS